jgi:hypothetical protein
MLHINNYILILYFLLSLSNSNYYSIYYFNKHSILSILFPKIVIIEAFISHILYKYNLTYNIDLRFDPSIMNIIPYDTETYLSKLILLSILDLI